ncbi:MAG: MFS transporter, partial [Candidatus Thorarchaeota archaeon]|nr:MFS transporter [Candidatus Thorarchaeota archaeon]
NEYARKEESLGFIESMVQTIKNREFLAFEAMNFFHEMAFTIVTGSMIYYVQFVVRLEGFLASLPIIVVFLVMLVFSLLANSLVRQHGLKKIYIIGLLISSFGLIVLFFSGSILALVMLSLIVVGIGFGPVNLIWSPLLSDVIDYDETLTGKRRETTYAGMNALITKPAISIANAIFLLLISGFGFDNTLIVQPNSAVFGIQLGFALLTAVYFILSAIALWKRYTLDGEDWTSKKAELGRIHLQKEREYIEQLQREGKISKVYQKLYKESKEETENNDSTP